MPPIDPVTVVKGLQAGAGIISGLKGLFGGGKRRVSEAEKAQLKLLTDKQAVFDELLANARAYDPAKELEAATGEASKLAGKTMREELIGLNTDFRNAGGVPLNDTLFRVSESDIAQRSMEGLANFAANARLQFAQNKAAMLQTALASGGDLISSWDAIRTQGLQAQGQSGLALAGGIDTLLSLLKDDPTKTKGSGKGRATGKISDGKGGGPGKIAKPMIAPPSYNPNQFTTVESR